MAQIIIEFDANGNLGLKTSPDVAGNMVLCMGMLEVAKMAMQDNHQKNQNRVQPVPAGVVLPPMPGQ